MKFREAIIVDKGWNELYLDPDFTRTFPSDPEAWVKFYKQGEYHGKPVFLLPQDMSKHKEAATNWQKGATEYIEKQKNK